MGNGFEFVMTKERNKTYTDEDARGRFVNPGSDKYEELRRGAIFFDKSMLLAYTNSVIESAQKYICFSRPRRFGKTAAADMLCAYYDRTVVARDVFKGLKISGDKSYEKYCNRYDVIFLNMQDFLSEAQDIDILKESISSAIRSELCDLYPDLNLEMNESLVSVMQKKYMKEHRKYVVIIDEWDCIFREWKDKKDAQKEYLDFLRLMLKDKAYIALVYMTGILPIKKYGSHSALNMFDEFSMENPGKLAEFVGLTEEEVKEACMKKKISFEKCKTWYDGYSFYGCRSVYNPKSVITLLRTGIFDDYWNKTESYEALRIYLELNFEGVKDKILALMANDRRHIDTGSFTNDITTFNSADDVLTLLIHLGYLGYDLETKEIFIPNKEILQEFVTTTTASKWSEVVNAVQDSQKLLEATLKSDEKKVAQYVEKAHMETAHLQYNDENALSYTISLAYYAARGDYKIVREMPAGKGFADLTFIPKPYSSNKPAMIIELKWNKSVKTAIDQIKEKNYVESLSEIRDEVLLVGINYDKKSKKHTCKIERFQKG